MSRCEVGPGVSYVCFGEYKCPQCNHIWESSKAWRDYGQKCKYCDELVNATGLEELFNYICKPCYNRSKGKEGRWKYKLCKEGRSCRSCGEIVKPFLTHSEFIKAKRLWVEVEGSDHIDRKKVHERKLCEKCIRSGRNCSDLPVGKVEPQSKVEFEYYKINKESSSQDVGKKGEDREKTGSTKTSRINTGVTSELSFRQVASTGIIKPSSSSSTITYNSSTGEGNMSTSPFKTGKSGFRTFRNFGETNSYRSKDELNTNDHSSGIESEANAANKHFRKKEFVASQARCHIL